MKFNWKIFKKGKPIYWIIGAVFLFVIFYLISSGGSKATTSSGGITTINTGPSDAQVAASSQIALAQISAQAMQSQAALEYQAVQERTAGEVAIATLDIQSRLAESRLASETALGLGSQQITGQLAAINAQMKSAEMQAEYSFATAKMASETNLAMYGLDTQVAMKNIDAQLEGLRVTSNMNIAVQNIQAGVAHHQIDAGVNMSQIAAGVSMYQTDAQKDVALATIASTNTQAQINANLISQQLTTNAQMLRDQLNANNEALQIQSQNVIAQSLIGQVGSLKKKDRDESLQIVSGYLTGNPVSYTNPAKSPAIIFG